MINAQELLRIAQEMENQAKRFYDEEHFDRAATANDLQAWADDIRAAVGES